MKKVESVPEVFARLRVVGVGGSGGNAINHMIASNLRGVEFIAANTDAQDLKQSRAKKKIHLGKVVTRGLGTGMHAGMGRESAEEASEELASSLKGSDLVFIACGMGGGTGTGASPVVAKIANELGILTVAIVTKPFGFEGKRRMELAEEGINELSRNVDAILIIPNDKILETVNQDTQAKRAFAMSDDVLLRAVKGISDLITTPGNINVDFADIKTTMNNSGRALMGVGKSKGENRAQNAARDAIASPLLDISIKGAKRVLFSIASKDDDISMAEIEKIAKYVTELVDPSAKIIFGTSNDDSLKKGEVQVTVIATSFDGDISNEQDSDYYATSGSLTSGLKNKEKDDSRDFVHIGDEDLEEEEEDGGWFGRR